MKKFFQISILILILTGGSADYTFAFFLKGRVYNCALDITYKVNAYDATYNGILKATAETELFSGLFSLECIQGDTIRRIEILDTALILINTIRNDLGWWDDANVGDIPLPVKLSSFAFEVYKNNVTLSWITIFELNNDYFLIFRDGQNIWKIKGRNEPSKYDFIDIQVPVGIHNYFLRQYDYNGNYEDFYLPGEVSVNNPPDYEINAYPNPFNSQVKIKYNVPVQSNVTAELFDINGRKIKTVVNNSNTPPGYYETLINADELSSGIYFCRIIIGKYVKTLQLLFVK